MKRVHTLLKLVPLILFPVLACSAAPKHTSHTHVRLVADVSAMQPGKEFTVGVLLSMDQGWHTYWLNPGEAGLPTQIAWKLPEGFVAGKPEWPVPHKNFEAGDLITYGYEGEIMLLVPISVPATAKSGSKAALKAAVHWLECERQCVPGEASVSLTLPVGVASAGAANEALFDKYRKLLPGVLRPATGFSLHVQPRAASLRLELHSENGNRFDTAGSAAPDFYPAPPPGLTAGRTTTTATPDSVVIELSLSAMGNAPKDLTLPGVVVFRLEGKERNAVAVEFPLPPGFVQGLSKKTNVLDQPFTTLPSDHSAQPLFLYIGFALIGGLLLNIMPCVLPVIALKLFGMLKLAGDAPGKVKRLGWLFSLGILASFLALAVIVIVLQAAGRQVGWGFQFQEPIFVIGMSAIVFAFGLSLFGVFEVQPPRLAVTGVGSLAAKQEKGGKGYAASFSEGVFATILATPCTAPFLGASLGFAFTQPAWIILIIFSSVACGMALPYLLLTENPALLKFLPKPGRWMETAKQFMGFLMMATLLWLLYILGKQIGTEGIVWTSAFLLTVGIACWLVGRFATLTVTRRKYLAVWVSAVLIAGLGYWIFVESVLDIRSVLAGTASPQAPGAPGNTGIAWEPFSRSALETYLREERAVFIDFTADWCLTCKVNEKAVLAEKNVVEKFASSGITAIRADWTNRNPDITKLLEKFGRAGVPLYVVFPAGKPTEPILLPEVITPGIVMDAIGRATAPRSAVVGP